MALLYNERQIAQPQSFIDTSIRDNAMRGALDTIGGIADVVQEKKQEELNKEYQNAFTTFSIEASNQLKKIMLDTSTSPEFASNPRKMLAEFETAKSKLMEKIDNDDVKFNLEVEYLTNKDSFLNQAEEKRRLKADMTLKESILNDISSEIEPLKSVYKNNFTKLADGKLQVAGEGEQDLTNFIVQAKKIEEYMNMKGESKDLFGESKPIFSEQDREQVKTMLNNAKIESGYEFINKLFETDQKGFIKTMDEFKNKPASVIQSLNLTQKEYENFSSYFDNLEKMFNENQSKTFKKSNSQIVQLAQDTLSIDTKLNIAKIETDKKGLFLKEASKEGIAYLSIIEKEIENARQNGMDDKDYYSRVEALDTLKYKVIKSYDEEPGFYFRKKAFKEAIDYIDENMKGFDETTKMDLKSIVLFELQKNNIDYNSLENQQGATARQFAKQAIANYTGIDINDNQFNTKLTQTKQEVINSRVNKFKQYIIDFQLSRNADNI